MDLPEQGYPDSRFATAVDEDLYCTICNKVLREPLQCEMNEHHFCSSCIKNYLLNEPKCPSCMQDLSLKTLRKPAKYLTKHLGSLMIQCDYESRGCSEVIKLEDLPHHVMNDCGYAPVSCQNDGCCQVVNKQDKIRHETESCEQRRKYCHNCNATRIEVGELNVSLEKLVKNEIHGLKVSFEELMKKGITDLKLSFEAKAKNETTELKVALQDLKAQVYQMMQSLSGITNTPCPATSSENVIVVIGGYNGRDRLTTAEMYVWSMKKWVPLPETTHPRSGSSAVFLDDQVVIAGGRVDDDYFTSTIESINLNTTPPQWVNLPGELPHPSYAQSCVLYNNSLIMVGGDIEIEFQSSDGIYEISLQPPYTCKLLSTMPSPRSYHRVELFGDKIIIIGGITEAWEHEQSVLIFDIPTKKYTEISQLQSGIKSFASVIWGDYVVIIGGECYDSGHLNTVKMFNIKTGKLHMQLPSLKQERAYCTAVVINNHIVVIGGLNSNKFLDTVECFSFSTCEWSELPPMTEHERSSPRAVVVPVDISNYI